MWCHTQIESVAANTKCAWCRPGICATDPADLAVLSPLPWRLLVAATGDATKWKYVDHFALSAFLLLGLVLLGIFARGYAISRNRQMDRRFWWMHNMTRNDDDEDKGKEIIQITL